MMRPSPPLIRLSAHQPELLVSAAVVADANVLLQAAASGIAV